MSPAAEARTNGRDPNDEPWPRTEAAWRARAETEFRALHGKLDIVLDHLLKPTGWALACSHAMALGKLVLGRDGANVRILAGATIALAVLAVALWGVSASLSIADLVTLSTGG